ncbi:MAG: RagB/SusD family nutrient uptake outer membrane protein [Candidatus Cryptobacteroides sp.]
MKSLFRTILSLSLLLSLSSCNKWLDVAPENEQPASTFWQTKEEVQSIVMGSYQQLRACLDQFVKWGEVRGDVTELGPGLASNEEMLAVKNIEIKPDNSICNWQPLYNAINRCNSVIKYAPGVLAVDKTFTEEHCASLVAEAYWVRALCYFYLVRTFKDVPYVTEPYLDDHNKFEVPKTDGKEVLDNEIEALTSHCTDLPVTYGTGSWQNKGRATVWAVYALLADMYLWQEDYENCMEMCSRIERSKLFSLLPTGDWYRIYYPGNSEESIFELQWSSALEQSNNLFGWFYNDGGSNNYSISDAAAEKFNEYPLETDVRGEGGSYIAASSKIWKYAGTARGVNNLRESTARDANWIIYRYADILLMHAEALVAADFASGIDEAFGYVVSIRERAGYESMPEIPVSYTEAIDLILDERLRELCFEGKRWFDLVRVAVRNGGEYKEKLISLLLLNIAAKDRPLYESKLQNVYGYYLPINELDIEASGGILEQNPYYL